MIYAEPVPSGIKGKEYDRIRRQNRIKAGICVSCGKNPTADGKKSCEECLQKNAERETQRRQMLLDKGMCIQCGINPVESGKVRCAECNKQNQERYKKRYEKRKNAGLCVVCGKRPARPGRTLCNECSVSQKKSGYKRRRETGKIKMWRELGLCHDCGKETVPGKCFCPECLKKRQDIAERMRQRQGVKEHREKIKKCESAIVEAKKHGFSM